MGKFFLLPLIILLTLTCFLMAVEQGTIIAAEKVRFATSVRDEPAQELPMLAAEELSIWKKNALEVEWIPIRSGSDTNRAIAAGRIDLAIQSTITAIQGAAYGVPLVMVAELGISNPFYILVRPDSPIREPKELRGARIAIPRLGGASHAFGLVGAKALGIEKEVRFVSMGGPREMTAGLRAGAVEATMGTAIRQALFIFEGKERLILNVGDYLPKEWSDYVLVCRKEFAEGNPELVAGVIKAFFQATDFVMKNQKWTVEKLKSNYGHSGASANEVYRMFKYSKEGRLERRAVENVTNFVMEYGIIAKEKAMPVDKLFTNTFIR